MSLPEIEVCKTKVETSRGYMIDSESWRVVMTKWYLTHAPSLENDRKSEKFVISGDLSMFLPKPAFKT